MKVTAIKIKPQRSVIVVRALPKSLQQAAGLLKDRKEDLDRYYKKQRLLWKKVR